MRLASMAARRNSSSLGSAAHCASLPWTMKNPPRSPPENFGVVPAMTGEGVGRELAM
jgi:hypothetical protein